CLGSGMAYVGHCNRQYECPNPGGGAVFEAGEVFCESKERFQMSIRCLRQFEPTTTGMVRTGAQYLWKYWHRERKRGNRALGTYLQAHQKNQRVRLSQCSRDLGLSRRASRQYQ